MKHSSEDERACDFCGYGGAPTQIYPGYGMSKDMGLCDVCAYSFAGNVGRYPTQYDHTTATLARIMSQQTNYLLDKLGKL